MRRLQLHNCLFLEANSKTELSYKLGISFALIAIAPLCQVCDRSLTPVRGPLPARRRLAAILPGLYLSSWPVKLPSSREGDRNLVFRAAPAGATLQLVPVQFTKRRIRIFITMPSAKNMNRTEDPP
jgi:hypothetical protein